MWRENQEVKSESYLTQSTRLSTKQKVDSMADNAKQQKITTDEDIENIFVGGFKNMKHIQEALSASIWAVADFDEINQKKVKENLTKRERDVRRDVRGMSGCRMGCRKVTLEGGGQSDPAMAPWSSIFLLLILSISHTIQAQIFNYPTANLSKAWTNNPSLPHSVNFTDGSAVRAILLRGSFGPRFACGFYCTSGCDSILRDDCNSECDSYLFAVFIVQTDSGSGIVDPTIGFPQVVWSANRNNPVRENATLRLMEI
ncbi:hypothetical protein QJS04_geneDACA012746 [Acorus gramineus]|uniref:Uncharacterized protein n=1 Tax=Acorus gramineus TaxID=55184 RepID=A0AAV9A270_ACOGR|nr:hypothetical protein QJS04_geneDACA012746 [Acorus gramineus]